MMSDHWRLAYGIWCSQGGPSDLVFMDLFHSLA
jgi:hypothetical protein